MARTLRVTWWFLYASIALLIFGIVCASLPDRQAAAHPPTTQQTSGADVIGILAITWGAIGIPVCLWLIWIYRRYARRAADILSGANRLAQWTCSAEEWDRYRQTVKQRARKNLWMILIICGGTAVVLVGVAIAVLLGEKPPAPPGEIAAVIGVVLGIVFGLFLLFWFIIIYLPERILRHPTSRDVFIGSGGLISAGRFQSWQIMGASLKTVRYEPADPGTLVFRWSQPGMGIAANTGSASGPMECLVPVPKAHDADARQVVAFFSKQFQQPPSL